MFNVKAENPTALRQARVEFLLTCLVETTASDLKKGLTTREIAIPALSKIVSSVLSNSGKGHAERVYSQVVDAVDNALDSPAEATEAA